jgi:hypothetical protein
MLIKRNGIYEDHEIGGKICTLQVMKRDYLGTRYRVIREYEKYSICDSEIFKKIMQNR